MSDSGRTRGDAEHHAALGRERAEVNAAKKSTASGLADCVEAFEVGFSLAQFIPGCHDGRDLARFFAQKDFPHWVSECWPDYERQTCATTPIDKGIVVTKTVLLAKCKTAAKELQRLEDVSLELHKAGCDSYEEQQERIAELEDGENKWRDEWKVLVVDLEQRIEELEVAEKLLGENTQSLKIVIEKGEQQQERIAELEEEVADLKLELEEEEVKVADLEEEATDD